MKTSLLVSVGVVALIAVAALSSLIAYRAGERHMLGLQQGTFVGTLGALQYIRKGDIQAGTQRIESLCFLSAVLLMADDHYRSDLAIRTSTPTLVSYRHTYRPDETAWSPTEKKLEAMLTQGR